ncbi:MAG TPA: MBL fold metallo-hydrolase [Tenuifilaceae bacterium]|nr:MBL fold metallo-hydrolase [Tenuifilaceae bacterium]HPE19006.1 MBL fold metallo-hydrolase [Tenuifilaceae bacterium]HPJ46159.1 MBL fold metallo-hydrolase [Tenuifilaceae bacterium]HPQ34687.1 MBL fold metallo-hydrolase [Tenuifilaceae bacterium]HRX68115.1 MBL fold metallo-hydrolase [Tenuifilaceae bacterium]
MKIQSFNIANFKVDGGAMFGVVPKVLWNKAYPADENNLIPLSLRTLVVETGGRVILTDNGFGDKQSEKFFSHFHIFGGDGLISGLAKMGYKPEDITDVILTHLHYDHCGGGVKRNSSGEFELVFPNARYHVSKAQWESALNPNAREADSFLEENMIPMRDLGALNLIEKEGGIAPGVEIRFFNGHTRGQIVPIFSLPSGKKLVFAADLFPSTAHIHLAWNMSYDVEPLVTMQEKEAFLNEALQNGYILYYQHDYFTECSSLIQTPKGIRAGERMTLDEALAI